jgi:hypothetical protein
LKGKKKNKTKIDEVGLFFLYRDYIEKNNVNEQRTTTMLNKEMVERYEKIEKKSKSFAHLDGCFCRLINKL